MSSKNETVSDAVNEEISPQETQDTRQYFISDEKFKLLRHYQQLIFEVTEFSPALRKVVNELITVENLEKVKSEVCRSLA